MILRLTTLALFILFYSIDAQALITKTGDKSFAYFDTDNNNHHIEFGSEIDGNITYVAVIRHQSTSCSPPCLVYLVRTDTGRYFARFQERAVGYYLAMAGSAASLSPDTMKPIVTHPQGESALVQFNTQLLGITLPGLRESSYTGKIITIPVDPYRTEDTIDSIELRKITNEKESAFEGSETTISEKLAGDMHIIDEWDFTKFPDYQ